MQRLTQRIGLIVLLALAMSAPGLVAQDCALVMTSLNFGAYTSAQLNGSATGRVTCAGAWEIPMDAGTGAGATETTRKMTGPFGTTLNYSLFRDSARTQNWGNTTTTEMTGTGNANVTVYGRIAASQFVISGTYTDTIHTATTSFIVTATISNSCTISAGNLSFGTYTGAVLNGTSMIVVSCTKNAPYYVGLNAGTATGATVTTRKLTSGTHTLNYALYSNSGHSTNWGNTVGTDTVTGAGSGTNQQLTVYGQIPANQSLIPGTYSDTITATITY
jgi:spore coat protein U domain-containing protein, fimbrial subunit CupE1/2/3/6